MNKPLITLASLLLAAPLLRAQEAPPSSSLVNLPPPGSAWTVRVTNPAVPEKKEGKASSKDKPAQKVSLPVSLSMKFGQGQVTHGQITFSDDHQDEFYVVNGSLLIQAKETKRVYAVSLQSSEMDPYSMQVSSFPGIGWIAKGNFRNVEKKNGVDCAHYTKTERLGDNELKLEAWIGQADRYPVEVKVGELVYHYDAITPLTEDVPLPEEFRRSLTLVSAERSALEAMRRAIRRQ